MLVASVALTKGLIVAAILCAIEINRHLVPLLMKDSSRWTRCVLWVCCLCVFIVAYYLVDLLLFPHADRAMFRSRDVALLSIVSMLGGLIATYYAPLDPAKAVQ